MQKFQTELYSAAMSGLSLDMSSTFLSLYLFVNFF